MRHQAQPVGIIDQSIACDPGLLLVCLGKSSVNDHHLAVAFDRAFSIFTLHRNMAVDDVSALRRQTEFPHHIVDHVFFFQKLIIGVLLFHMGLLLRQKIPLEGSHLILAEQRGIRAQPDIPHDVLSVFPVLLIQSKEALAHIAVQRVIQGTPLEGMSEKAHLSQAPVLIQRHASVIQQVVVVHLVEVPFRQQKPHMLLQLLAAQERAFQALHHFLFLLGQRIRILRVNGREIHIQHRVFLSIQGNGSFLIIDPVEQRPVLHMKSLLPLDNLSLHLELDHGDCLMDPQVHLHLRLADGIVLPFQGKAGTGIRLIDTHGKRRQRQEIDAVPVLQNIQIPIARADPDGVGNTAPLPRRGAHPQHIMVPPLDIQGMVVHQLVHDDMRPRSPVIDISHNMKVIHDQALDQGGDRRNKPFRSAYPDDRHDDLIIVGFLIVDLRLLRDQLLDDIGKILRQGFAHLGAGILARRPLAHLDQTVQVDLVPVLHIILCLPYDPHLLPRIIDQRRQRPFFPCT